MAKFYALFLPLCFLLFSSCLAQSEQNECLQLNRLKALQPDHRISSEAGTIETWNPNNNQLRCAGVGITRYTIRPNGLRMPSYSNAPQLIYIQRGKGVFGMVFPGCAETFHEAEQESRQGQSRKFRDRHQKIHHFEEGDMIAVPTGIAFWIYNNGENPVVAVSLLYTDSYHNQLDPMPRRFYLAGNQEHEFVRYQQQQQQQEGGNNMYSEFDEEFLEEIFNIDRETARHLKGLGDKRKSDIVEVREGLRFLNPPTWLRRQQEQEQEQQEEQQWPQEKEEKEEQEQRGRHGRQSSDNGLEETVCTMKLRVNIGRRTYPDIFVREAGAISTLNSLDLPVLQWLGLSAEHGILRRNAMLVPHYNLNANSIVYALRGRARMQVVNCTGDSMYDKELEAGQLLMVPQNFPVALRAESETFEYVSFKTNDRAMMAHLAGRTSLLKLLPEEVLVQSYRLRAEQARQLKNNNHYVYLAPPNTQSD